MSDTEIQAINKIAILGGTGNEGKGLAYRWAKSGLEVVIGSRQIEKAQTAADLINQRLDQKCIPVIGMENSQASAWCELAVLTVPYAAHLQMLETVKENLVGKILVDVTVPLVPPKITKVQMPPAGSATQEAQNFLGENVKVVCAFQNISYERLWNDEEVGCDVIVCGTGKDSRTVVIDLVKKAGMVGWDGGVIENSAVVEGMTSILLGLNRQFEGKAAGIQIIGLTR